MKKLLFMAPLALSLALAGCGETTVEKSNGSSETAAKADAEKEEKFSIGDTVKVNDVEITVTSAKLRDADQYIDASNGKVLRLDFTVKNTSDSKVFIDSGEFNLYQKGESREMYFGSSGDIPLSGDLNKGKVLKGFIEYDVAPAKKYELIYQPTFSLDNKEITWIVKP